MKKVLSIVIALASVFAFSLLSGFSSTEASAKEINSSGYLTKDQLKEFNDVLETLRQEANTKLENHETDFTVSANVSFQEEPISLVFNTNQLDKDSNKLLAPANTMLAAASAAKEYSATISNTAGFNFSHEVFGKFVYSGGKITSYTADANLSGFWYGKSDKTTAKELDPSVVRVTSIGTFRALKYAPVEYTTKIVVELYGSGDYRVISTSIN